MHKPGEWYVERVEPLQVAFRTDDWRPEGRLVVECDDDETGESGTVVAFMAGSPDCPDVQRWAQKIAAVLELFEACSGVVAVADAGDDIGDWQIRECRRAIAKATGVA